MKHIQVAVGVVERENKVFVCLRAEDAHQGGLWEFPGGKVEEGESPQQALQRELHEEIGIQVASSTHLVDINHKYAEKTVTLHVYRVTAFTGEAHGKEGQPNEWRNISKLDYDDFPAANREIIDALKKTV